MKPNPTPSAGTAAPADAVPPPTPHADPELLANLENELTPQQPAASASATPEIPTAKLVEGILGPAFMIIAPNWKVSDSEISQLSAAYGAVLDKYFPDGLGQFGVEIGAALITAAVIVPRLKIPPKAEPKKPADA